MTGEHDKLDDSDGTTLREWRGRGRVGSHFVYHELDTVEIDGERLYRVIHIDTYGFKVLDEAEKFSANLRKAFERNTKIPLKEQDV